MDVGIIGGADGPTAVISGGSPAGLALTLLLTAAVLAAAVWFFRHRRKK